MHEIDDTYVEKHHQMDPETETLIGYGSDLQDGMRVLIENGNYRSELSYFRNKNAIDRNFGMSEELQENARKFNRWCTVYDYEIFEGPCEKDNIVSFTGIYDDGTMRKFNVPEYEGWFVKKDTIPEGSSDSKPLPDISKTVKLFTPWNKTSNEEEKLEETPTNGTAVEGRMHADPGARY